MRDETRPRAPEPAHRSAMTLLAGTLGLTALGACFIDFDRYDPRLGEGGSTSEGGSGGAASTGGGTTTGPGGAGGSTSDGGGGAGGSGGGPPPCGVTGTLADDFDDGNVSSDWSFITGPGATLEETGGERVILLPNMQSQASWSGFSSVTLVDMSGQGAFIEVPVMVNTATTANAFLHVVFDSENYVSLSQSAGTLSAGQRVGSIWLTLAQTPFDSTLHRWWQIRDDGGTMRWETSPDGQSWTVHASKPVSELFPLDLVQIEAGANTEGGEVDPGEAHFDNLMGGGTPAPWCPVAALSDDFDDGVASRMWSWGSYEGGGCNHDETEQKLVLSFDGSTSDCGYVTAQRFDLTGGEIFVEVPAVAPQSGAYTYFRAELAPDYGIEFLVANGSLTARIENGSGFQVVGSPNYDAVAHRWWRFREDGGTLHWDVSADGIAWNDLAQVTTPSFGVEALRIILGAGLASASALPGTTEYDNLNVPP